MFQQVAAVGVSDGLGDPRRPRGIEDINGVVEWHRFEMKGLVGPESIIPAGSGRQQQAAVGSSGQR